MSTAPTAHHRPPAWSLSGDPAGLLREQGFALLDPAAFGALVSVPATVVADWAPFWDRLAPDRYLRDGGRYRSRRHGCFVQALASPASPAAPCAPAGTDAASEPAIVPVPHRAHWQSTDYNALHGGIDRWFEPLEPDFAADGRLRAVVSALGRLFADVTPQRPDRWYVETHPFRIDASSGVGRPTPEGAHRDGVDFVAVILIGRQAVKGGETRVFEARGPLGIRFVIETPWSALLLDDARVIHETTPIQPTGDAARRDTLVVTWRRGGFQAA